MNYSITEDILHNVYVIPALFGTLIYNRLDKTGKIFYYFILLSVIIELTRVFMSSTLMIRLMTYLYFTLAIPLLYYVMLCFSNFIVRIHLLYIVNISLVLPEIVFLEDGSPRVLLSKLIILFILSFVSINAFVNTIDGFLQKRVRVYRLLIILPHMIFFFNHFLFNILMLFLYNKSRAPLFRELSFYLKYIGFFSALAFAAAFYISPKKEQYLE